MQVPLIEARNVAKVFRGGRAGEGVTALKDCSLRIWEHVPSIISVAGESGSGKTTLARLLLGFAAPTSGEVLYNGRDLKNLTRQEKTAFRKEIQAIFQDPYESYNPFYPVDRVFTTVIKKFHLAKQGVSTRDLMVEALETVGLRAGEILGKYPHQLSGGQRQRIMVARAFLLSPKLILADEPVSMVDASLRATILAAMLQLKQERGVSIVYVTHDLSTAYQISDEIIILYRGITVERGNIHSVINSPLHPYTQLLVSSIPTPDPKRRWSGVVEMPPEEEMGQSLGMGCRFLRSCPRAMDICRRQEVPLYSVEGDHEVACFLYQDENSRNQAG
jgi:oligopeptide/dipeptide ABC transporter ATP-binding protein